MIRKAQNNSGFSLAELLIATFLLALVLGGLIQVFLRSSMLTEISRNKTAALSEAVAKMEEVRSHIFEDIESDYDNTAFALTELNGWGYIYTNALQADLIEIEVVIGWRDKYNRIIGEDADLNGTFDVGSEDADGNGKMSSMVTLISTISDRT